MKRLIPLLLILFTLGNTPFAIEPPQNLSFETLEQVPILNKGRYKPLSTFAGESMKTITGKWNYEGYEPLNLLFSMITNHDWTHAEAIKVGFQPLKEELGLPLDKNRFSFETLVNIEKFQTLADQVIQKSESNQDLTPLENHVGELIHKLNLFNSIISTRALTLVPRPGAPPADAEEEEAGWLPVNQPTGYSAEVQSEIQNEFSALITAYKAQNPTAFTQASARLKALLANLNPQRYYPTGDKIGMEIHYYDFRPFLNSWILYLIGAILFGISLYFIRFQKLYWVAFGAVILGFLFHTYGMLLRSLISGRAPVSNMYESVVWVGWGIILFAMIMEMIYRRRWFITIASVLGVGMLILADILPFESNIEPLVPVLRSNYWLIIHVLTITLSYSIFALAMGLAHVILFVYFFKPNRKDILQELSLFLYRSIQVGVVLLAAGTILGGVWAAESWGRFWGWDPKETWALISLLGYLAILHSRYTGWLKDFGTAVCSILAFQLILMTWYGVNFVLATGLHSYGFGTGGGGYVITYLLIEGLFLAGVAYKYKMMEPPKMPPSGQAEPAS